MICPDCQENRYHYHSNLRPIEREKPVNIIDEAMLKLCGGEFSNTTSEGAIRAAIAFAVKMCAEVANDHRCGEEGDFICRGMNCAMIVSAEIMRAAGLGEEKKP